MAAGGISPDLVETVTHVNLFLFFFVFKGRAVYFSRLSVMLGHLYEAGIMQPTALCFVPLLLGDNSPDPAVYILAHQVLIHARALVR